MRKNRPFSSSTISLGSVRNLRTKIKKSTQGPWTTVGVGKYSQKKKEKRSSKVAPPSSDDQNDFPKLAELIDNKKTPKDQQVNKDVGSNIDPIDDREEQFSFRSRRLGLQLLGHHGKIAAWRHEQRVARTRQRRPDLFERWLGDDGDTQT